MEPQGLTRQEVTTYGNTGVMVFGKQHRDVFSAPTQPIPRLHCVEQHLWVARLHELDVKVRLLPKRCIWQWWPRKSLNRTPSDAILHYSGMQFEGG